MRRITTLLTTSLCLLGLGNIGLAASAAKSAYMLQDTETSQLLGAPGPSDIYFNIQNTTGHELYYGYITRKSNQHVICYTSTLRSGTVESPTSLVSENGAGDYSPDRNSCKGSNLKLLIMADGPDSTLTSPLLIIDTTLRQPGTCLRYDISADLDEATGEYTLNSTPVDRPLKECNP